MVAEVLGSIKADPASLLDYTIDWSEWLDDGDTLTASTWDIPAGISSPADTNSTTYATVWLTGGTIGVGYRVTNHITTADGRQDERSFRLVVTDR